MPELRLGVRRLPTPLGFEGGDVRDRGLVEEFGQPSSIGSAELVGRASAIAAAHGVTEHAARVHEWIIQRRAEIV